MTDQLGRYEILEKIGEGGFAIVYRARDLELDRLVALKELRSMLLTDATWVKRFRREAQAIARLDHPQIVPIYDIGQAEGRHFLVMRLIDGSSLDEVIARRGPLPWNEAVNIALATAAGLDYAHSQGILHRDLKPGNILVDLERGPMLTDFGFAKLVGESHRSVTVSGDIVGTPHYIAPEAWEGEKATPQADIYALGCILYEIVTGQKLFQGETPPAIMMSHFKPLQLPTSWPDNTPPTIAQVLRTALARKPGDRYQTAGAMAEALADLGDGSTVSVAAAVAESSAVVETIDSSSPTPSREPPPTPDSVPDSVTEEATMWQQKAEQALTEGNLEGARSAAYQWQELMPDAPELINFQRRLEPQLQKVETTPTPMPAPTPAVDRKGRGCFWVSGIAGLVIIVVALIGLGGLCSTLNTTLATISDILPTVEVGDTVEEAINIPLPSDTEGLALDIEFGSGELTLRPGAENGLVEGSAQYNVEQLRPQINVEQNEIRLRHENSLGLAGWTTSNIKNDWSLRLAAVPLALTIETGAARGDIELGGLALTNVKISQGAANFELSFSEPNLVAMETFDYKGIGSVNTVLEGLANARAEEIIFEGGLGDFTMDFSGDLQRELTVTVDGGAGTFVLIVPEGTPAEVSVNAEANVNTQGAWTAAVNGYRLTGAGPAITFDVNVDNLRLRTR